MADEATRRFPLSPRLFVDLARVHRSLHDGSAEIEALEAYGVGKIYSPEDGRQLGLEGMISDMLTRAAADDGGDDRRSLADLPQLITRIEDRVIREIDDIRNPANHYLHYWQLPAFELESDEPIHYNVDGEPVHASHMAFSVLPRCINVVTGSGT